MMTITNAATEVLRTWSRTGSTLRYPVIYLGMVSDTPAGMTDALVGGGSGKAFEDIARKTLQSQPRYLYPLVYPGSRFIWLTTTISGFRFVSPVFYPPVVRRAMRSGVLDAAERGLLLKDQGGAVVLPKDVAGAL